MVVDLNLCRADLVGLEIRGCSTFGPTEHSVTVGSTAVVVTAEVAAVTTLYFFEKSLDGL